MPVFPTCLKSKQGFTLIELLVSMLIVSFIGGAIFVTFAQGIRIWQASVRESEQGREEFFFEELRSELRNAFLYNKSAFNGKSETMEFYALVPQLRGKNKDQKIWKVPAQIRYQFDADQKLIRKEITFYEKILNPKSTLQEKRIAIENVADVGFEYYLKPKKGTSASWVGQWNDTCFPEAIKIKMSSKAHESAPETRVISMPVIGECIESEETQE